MMQKLGLFAAMSLALLACGARKADDGGLVQRSGLAKAELIVLAAPRAADAYYAAPRGDIIDFQVRYARQIADRDNVVILTDAASYPDYVAALGRDRVAVVPMDDIWMRDFSLSNAERPVMFRYTAAGQAGVQRDADGVQETLTASIEAAGLDFAESDLLNDGGNFVDDYDGRAVVSRKFLADNGLAVKRRRVRRFAARRA